MVATVLPEWVVRRWTSRVRRPLPVRVSIAETSWVPGGRGLMEPGAAGRLVGVARTHAPASRRGSAVGGLSAGKLVRRILAASASGRRCCGAGKPRPRGTGRFVALSDAGAGASSADEMRGAVWLRDPRSRGSTRAPERRVAGGGGPGGRVGRRRAGGVE